MSPREVADELNVRIEWVYSLIRRGQLEAKKTAAGWRIPRSAVADRKHWMKERDAAAAGR